MGQEISLEIWRLNAVRCVTVDFGIGRGRVHEGSLHSLRLFTLVGREASGLLELSSVSSER